MIFLRDNMLSLNVSKPISAFIKLCQWVYTCSSHPHVLLCMWPSLHWIHHVADMRVHETWVWTAVSLIFFAVFHAILDVLYLSRMQNMRMTFHIHALRNICTYLANQRMHTDKICFCILVHMNWFCLLGINAIYVFHIRALRNILLLYIC